MKKRIALLFAAVFALTLIAGCAGGQASSSAAASSEGASSEAASSEAAASAEAASGIVVDAAAKTVTIPAVATGNTGESSIHFLVNQDGGNAGKAHFTTAVTPRELYDALESIGAEHGDNIALDDKGGTIEGSDIKMTIAFDGKEFIPSELVAGADGRTSQPRFGGNIEPNEEMGTGCMFCLESCSLGITSDAAYEYTEPMEFTPTADMPAAGTEVTFTLAL